MAYSFGKDILKRRLAKGLSLRKVAGSSGMSASYLSLIERSLMPAPADEKLEALAKALGIQADQIYALAGRLPPKLRQYVKANTAKATAAIERLRSRDNR